MFMALNRFRLIRPRLLILGPGYSSNVNKVAPGDPLADV